VGIFQGDGPADAAARPGDDCDFIDELAHEAGMFRKSGPNGKRQNGGAASLLADILPVVFYLESRSYADFT
jgi:hypothetical protein